MKSAFTCLLLVFLCVASSAESFQSSLDAAFISKTVDSLTAVVNREYFDPDVAKEVETALRKPSAIATYITARDADELAMMLTRDMYQVTGDKHLSVDVVRQAPTVSATPQINADQARALGLRRANAGVRKIEI